jgi:subtilase family protein
VYAYGALSADRGGLAARELGASELTVCRVNESFTVGASTMSDALAGFSSRGPVSFQGTRIKPDIVAPGQTVRSSFRRNTYAVLDGTSMATPHIAGAIALIYSVKPELIGNVDHGVPDRTHGDTRELVVVQQQRYVSQQPVGLGFGQRPQGRQALRRATVDLSRALATRERLFVSSESPCGPRPGRAWPRLLR